MDYFESYCIVVAEWNRIKSNFDWKNGSNDFNLIWDEDWTSLIKEFHILTQSPVYVAGVLKKLQSERVAIVKYDGATVLEAIPMW